MSFVTEEEGTGIGRRLDAELALQHRSTDVVGAHGTGAVPGMLVPPHQQPVALLPHRNVGDQPPGTADRLRPTPVVDAVGGAVDGSATPPGADVPARRRSGTDTSAAP
ncbi:hypothetical protein GCM10027072_64020 [Streptomyces bullii]